MAQDQQEENTEGAEDGRHVAPAAPNRDRTLQCDHGAQKARDHQWPVNRRELGPNRRQTPRQPNEAAPRAGDEGEKSGDQQWDPALHVRFIALCAPEDPGGRIPSLSRTSRSRSIRCRR